MNRYSRRAAALVGPSFMHWAFGLVGFVLAEWLLWSSWHGGGMPPASHAEQFWAGLIGAAAFGWGWECISRLFQLIKGSAPSKPTEHRTGE